ncbi:MAG: HAMP domain-containing histidine kinase, partial [Candidatus Solibacter usitatus]|nr:HAMP domain-containing histidine kinase [Candidatus Solibacter usitatus]
GLFEATAWPEALGTLRTRLHSRWRGFRGLSSGPPEETPPLGGPGGGMAGIFEEESPVLIAPRFRPRLEGPRGGSPIEGWVIAELNKTYLEKEYLPELVHKYFAGSDGLDYQVRIVSNSKLTDVIYQSDPGLPEGFFASADATGGLFPPRPDFQRGAGPGFGRMRPGGEAPSGGPPEPRGRWRVLVKHHSGSLESAVAQARARNLAISFAVLLFMAGGVAMLLITTQRAQRLARLQMEFVAGVSHELRTPLTVICSAGDNLADGLVANEQQVRRYGSVIRNEGRRLSEMVEQILGFAGLQAGRTRYAVQPVDLSEVVERALAVCDPGCEVDNQMAPDLPRVLADPTSLTHCVRNLLSNAEKYGNGSGWIGIRAESASNAVELRIEDRGPGIDPADLPHIFEPFYRGRRAIADQIHGAGLGLSLVRRIIEAHGGSVSASSTPGQGSCFTLRIPAAAGAVERPVESHGAENPAR